jgi:nucleoside-diphosphate-sugar epimerase
MDSSRLRALGWAPGLDLTQGLRLAYADFLEHHA